MSIINYNEKSYCFGILSHKQSSELLMKDDQATTCILQPPVQLN